MTMEFNLGELIKALRWRHKPKKMTREALAELLDTTSTTVYRWETNQHAPDLATLRKLADIFGVSPSVFLDGNNISELTLGSPETAPEKITITRSELKGLVTEVVGDLKEIERLRAENEELKDALKELKEHMPKEFRDRLASVTPERQRIALFVLTRDPKYSVIAEPELERRLAEVVDLLEKASS